MPDGVLDKAGAPPLREGNLLMQQQKNDMAICS